MKSLILTRLFLVMYILSQNLFFQTQILTDMELLIQPILTRSIKDTLFCYNGWRLRVIDNGDFVLREKKVQFL